MSIGLTMIDGGEQYHLENAKLLREAIIKLSDASLTHDNLVDDLSPTFRVLENWKLRHYAPRQQGETSGLSQENAERVYKTLDTVWGKCLVNNPLWINHSNDMLITEFQDALKYLTNKRLYQDLVERFVAEAKSECGFDVTVNINNQAFNETTSEFCIKTMLEFFKLAANTLEQLETDVFTPDFGTI